MSGSVAHLVSGDIGMLPGLSVVTIALCGGCVWGHEVSSGNSGWCRVKVDVGRN